MWGSGGECLRARQPHNRQTCGPCRSSGSSGGCQVISPADRAAAECRSGSHAGSRLGLGGRFRWPDCSFPDGEAPAAARSGDVRSRRPDTVLPTVVRPVPPLADGLRSRVLGVARGVTGCGSRGGAIAAHADGVFDAPESRRPSDSRRTPRRGRCRCKRRSGPGWQAGTRRLHRRGRLRR